MRGKIRWRCSRDVFSELPGKLKPCKPLLKCMHSRYCHCGPERGLSHSRGVPCAPRQEDAGPTQGQHNGTEPKFAVSSHKPDGALESELAVLVYRLVCQPVTLESWVRLPDAALDSDRAPALNSVRNKHRQTAGKHARNHFSAGPIVSFARSVVIIHLSFLRSAESITKHKLFEPGRRTR